MDLTGRDPVNPNKLLRYIASNAREEVPRYAELFESAGLENIIQNLERGLNPIVRSICENGYFNIKR